MSGLDASGREDWYASLGQYCLVCKSRKGLVLHHSTYEKEIRRCGGNKWEPNAGITLCENCHWSQHSPKGIRLPLASLRDENIQYAFSLMGPRAYDYLRRFYSGSDPRVEDLLSLLIGD